MRVHARVLSEASKSREDHSLCRIQKRVTRNTSFPWKLKEELSSFAESTTRISRLLDLDSKMKAVQILKEQISSLSGDAIEKYVLSREQITRFHIWGLCAKGSISSEIICVVVFRRHPRLGLIELNLIACKSSYCGEGFGSFFLKAMLGKWKSEGFAHVLTFADFCAVRFFETVGFSHKLSMPRDLYDTWIDKYSLATIMGIQLLHETATAKCSIELNDAVAVDVLVFYENVDRRPREIWAPGLALRQSELSVLVQYSFRLATFVETLPIESPRIRLSCG
jgi:N-acetylglutamate synthase-like GNAT family acetyltransferase